MTSQKRKTTFGVNIGTSSLLLVFVILCLVSFATLALVSAKANKNLQDKVVQNNKAYYEACNEANQKLAGIDSTLKSIYESSESKEDYLSQAGETIEFAIPVSDVQALDVTLQIQYPEHLGDRYFYISEWRLISTGSLSGESNDGNTLNLLF